MAKREPVTIDFGDQSFKIRPFSLDQIEQLEGIVSSSSLFGGKEKDGASPILAMRGAREVIAVAMSRDHADVDISDLDGDVQTFADAQATILRHAGFLADPLGEGEAAAANVQIGGTSEAV